MKVLGPVALSEAQAATLADGGQMTLAQRQFREKTKTPARLGDLLWVQEPVLLVTTAELIAAHRRPLMTLPAPFPAGKALDSMVRQCALRAKYKTRHLGAAAMKRAGSRATLEIAGFDASAMTVRCIVHLRQVDEFRKGAA